MKNTKFKTNILPSDSKNIGISMGIKASHIFNRNKYGDQSIAYIAKL